MYAVVDVGAFQFKVKEGDVIDAPSLEAEVGKSYEADKVLLIADGDKVQIGDPVVKGAKVTFEVVRHLRDEKDISFKFRRRKDSQKKIGHRQELTALKVVKIAG
ncbi:MAG: 50S ribosomal protein L21 [Elusimicrobia bacterium]|nr:50S ribosomal protein L21 [Elusimicrobiota bacterium]